MDDLRCSAWTWSEQVDPIGTAGAYAAVMVVGWPLPWPRDVSEIPELAPVAGAVREAKARLQAVATDDVQRVSLYRWDEEAGRFSGVAAPAGPSPADTALALLSGQRPAQLQRIAATEVLLCGHGRRDRCCGSLGTALEHTLRQGAILPADVSLWRTSHTGGHRFAPTAIVLPEGTCWGYLDERSLHEIVTRSVPVQDHLWCYRGCLGLGSPAVQAVEREVLGLVGWDLLDWPRTGEQLEDGRVMLTATSPKGDSLRWEGHVAVRRMVPVPQCGLAISAAEKSEPELVVDQFRSV